MRHRSLTFCSLRHDISQKLGPHTAALSAGSCSWGPLAELWMGSMLDPERRVMRLPARGSSVLSLLAHTTVTASLRYWQFPFSRSQDDKSDHSLSFPEMETANTSASNHKVSKHLVLSNMLPSSPRSHVFASLFLFCIHANVTLRHKSAGAW